MARYLFIHVWIDVFVVSLHDASVELCPSVTQQDFLHVLGGAPQSVMQYQLTIAHHLALLIWGWLWLADQFHLKQVCAVQLCMLRAVSLVDSAFPS